MRFARWSTAVVVAAAVCGGCGAAQSQPRPQSQPTVPAISLTQIPGNALRPLRYRVLVSDTVILRQRSGRGAGWQTIARWPVHASLRARLIADARAIRPGSMHPVQAVCHGGPIGDVGGWLLRVGALSSNCPPPSAEPLMRLLETYLPASARRG
jgi:hypothetical protein